MVDNNTYYITYLKIACIIAMYSLTFFYSFKENSELLCLIIFLIFDVFLFLFMGQSFYTIIYKNMGQFNNIIYKILWFSLWSIIPLGILFLFISHSMMVSSFNKLYSVYVVESNQNSIPLSERNRNEFQSYKKIGIVLFSLLILFFCILLNDWIPKSDYLNLYVILTIITFLSIGFSILGLSSYMIFIGNNFLTLRNTQLLKNN